MVFRVLGCFGVFRVFRVFRVQGVQGGLGLMTFWKVKRVTGREPQIGQNSIWGKTGH